MIARRRIADRVSLFVRALIALGVMSIVRCRGDSSNEQAALHTTYIGPELTPPPVAPEEAVRRSCEERMREVLAIPAAPGVPPLDASRTTFFMKAKGEPTLFVRAPEYTSEPVTETIRGYRQMLLSAQNPFGVINRILSESEHFPKQARDALLRDGYLYADDVRVGFWLTNLVQPHQLFGHERIVIQRGEEVLHAVRKNGRFYYEDGVLEGQPARFILFDRAAVTEEAFAPPVHRDVRSLQQRLSFERMEIRHVTDDYIVANLRYGSWWVPTVLRTSGAHVELECEILAPNARPEVDAVRAEGRRRQTMLQSLRRVMLAAVDEGLPFDEPRHEYGVQLDGMLRKEWTAAYLSGRDTYDFNGDEYEVFDAKGRPLVPEVCVDFVTDTLERASGTWWRSRGAPRGRDVGKLDFDALQGEQREEMRRAPDFIEYAKQNPDAFEVWDDLEPIELGDEDALYAYLQDHASDFAAGDAVLIKGKTPWDRVHVHFHSFFVYETDPVTGMPIAILGNAGHPKLRIWETEVRRTPKRVIVARIRFKTAWLQSIVDVKPLDSLPPLAAGAE